MKITRFSAINVHEFLPIDIKFYDELTFLTGLNGSGKTSALRLLMALLTPNIEEFSRISFSSAVVTLDDRGKTLHITATRSPVGLTLTIDSAALPLEVTSSELQLLGDAQRRDESSSPVFSMIAAHEVYKAIRSLSTPMFLGIDRRFFSPSTPLEDGLDVRRRVHMSARFLSENLGNRGSAAVAGLSEVNSLVVTKMQEIRAEQETLDEELRRKFFTRAFEYKPSDLGANLSVPSRAELDKYRAHLTTIERAAEGLRLPLPDLQSALSQFFDRMTKVTTSLEKYAGSPLNQRSSQSAIRPKGKKWEAPPEKHQPRPMNADLIEWVINKPQADRIMEHLTLLGEYDSSRTALREPIQRFLNLVNGFLKQTHKSVEVASSGELKVKLKNNPELRSMAALSSGEGQLLVMFAHLSLNPELAGSGVFIVDEPELSLHIDWQEKYVDAVRAANPSVQLIFATHSPAIILDRTDACCSLSPSTND